MTSKEKAATKGRVANQKELPDADARAGQSEAVCANLRRKSKLLGLFVVFVVIIFLFTSAIYAAQADTDLPQGAVKVPCSNLTGQTEFISPDIAQIINIRIPIYPPWAGGGRRVIVEYGD